MNKLSKTFSFSVKDAGIRTDDDGNEFGQIEAYGAIFNNVDEGNDSILPGAFKRTIQNSKARAQSRSKKYLAVMLWQHNTNEIIGGWYDLSEDATGLLGKGEIALATQRGREYYALVKAGMSDEFSIIYDIPTNGAKYRKDGVRELSELRLFSIDPVTFAMNDATYVVDVKAASSGATCGNVKGPLGPRDEAWDAGKAEGQIWAAATNSDGSVNAATAKKYFMYVDGDDTQKGSYSYPFWYVGSDPHICVGAVKAIAAAIQGSRGASAPDALKPKVATLYNRINAKYPDDPQLEPPWENDGGKGSAMTRQRKIRQIPKQERKTFEDHFNEEQCADLLEDWQDVIICALTSAVYDAFAIGDQPEADVRDALTAFSAAVMQWVEDGVKYGLSDYLDDNTLDYSSAENIMQYGSDSRPNYGYGYMSRRTPAMKSGRAISAANAETIQSHIKSVKSMAMQMKALHKSMNAAADDLATVLQGSEAAYGTDDGEAGNEQEGKQRNGTPLVKARSPQQSSSDDTIDETDISAALAQLQTLSKTA